MAKPESADRNGKQLKARQKPKTQRQMAMAEGRKEQQKIYFLAVDVVVVAVVRVLDRWLLFTLRQGRGTGV